MTRNTRNNRNSRKTVSPSIPEQGEEAVQAIKESLEIGLGRRGNRLEKFVTFRDLQDAELADVDTSTGEVRARPRPGGPGTGPGPGDGGAPLPIGDDNLNKPPRPRNVRARGLSLTAIGVSWADPGYDNHNYAEIFASFQPDWTHIRETFNADKPISASNPTPFFMGLAIGNLFLHNNLQSTVPTLEFRYPITSLTQMEPLTVQAILANPQGNEFALGEIAYLSGPQGWSGNGFGGQVTFAEPLEVRLGGVLPGGATPAPEGAELVRIPDENELNTALNPRPIYYWVRFVSQAGVVGDVQSEAGVPGQVFIDPEAIMNILTGRIRRSQLAQDIIAPINWITGPLNQLDGSGNLVYPTIADFVLAQGEDLLTEYDEIWQAVILGTITDTGYGGIAAAAALIQQIQGEVNEQGAYIGTLQTLQVGFEDGTATGVGQILSTIENRQLVMATNEGAMALIQDTLQVNYNDGVFLNQVQQQIEANADGINNAITLRVQQNIGGVISAAGFGIGLETEPGGDFVSTFAVAADQFAVMSAANEGRIATQIQRLTGPTRYRLSLKGDQTLEDGLVVDARVTVTVPFDAPTSLKDALKGRVFRVTARLTNPLRIDMVDAEGETLPTLSTQSLPGSYAVFPEQNIPFIIDTATGTVGIRGRLVVDGLIAATEAQIQELSATEIFSQNITNWGIINTRSLVGEVLATPRRAGWAVRMKTPSFGSTMDRVLEFSRWASESDNLPEPDFNVPASLDPGNWDYPQLGNTPPEISAFYLNSADGSAYIRGHLSVGGNTRIWTGFAGSDPGRYIVQMDQEFPIVVAPKDEFVAQTTVPLGEGDPVAYDSASINWIRANALFWINKNATAGFNTGIPDNANPAGGPGGFVYINGNPLEPPNGWGFVRVIRRLNNAGQPIGTGRVWLQAHFGLADNVGTEGHNALVGCTVALFLASANKNYGGISTTFVPSQRNNTGGIDLAGSNVFMDTHWLMIRATTASTTGGPTGDSGYQAYLAWRNLHPELIPVSEYWDTSGGHRMISGAVNAAASANYKLLAVIVERYDRNGNPIGGATGGVTMPYGGNAFVQQIATMPYTGPASSNTGAGGGGGGTPPGGGNSPPPPPGPGPGTIEP